MRSVLFAFLILLGVTPSVTSAADNIVILGDSLTAGYGLDEAQAYPALLQKKIDEAGLKFQVINAGVSGDTTTDGLNRVNWLLKRQAAVFIVALGANDGLRGLPPELMEKNLTAVLQKVHSANPGAKLLVAGMLLPTNFGPEYTNRFAAVFPAVAQQTGATLIPFLLEGVGGRPEMNQPDRIHPTAEGQRILAENVWKILKPVLENVSREN
ncbi:MAG TPA: arylesterase [Chthoniobacterales bacterium]